MKTGIKKIGSKIWRAMPIWLAIVAMGVFIYFWFRRDPTFVNYDTLVSGSLNEAQKQTITMATELNKLLVSLNMALFGAVGFYLAHYRKEIQVAKIAPAFIISLILLGLADYFAFRAYTQLTGELAQNALAMIPEMSKVLYYIEMEFWAFFGSSLILLFIFVFVFIDRKNNSS